MDVPIAIVGIGLRLPGGCRDTASFWDLLVNKRDARKEIPSERFNIDGFHTPQRREKGGAGKLSLKHGYFLDEAMDRFDAGFFSMSQAEVERLDPQQRLLLEVVYEALENAGETESRGTNVGVYAGSFGADWAQMQGKDLQDESVYGITGRDDFVHGNRVSYEFGLHGPSLTVKTACSSSLIALHLACESLQRGDCSGAIVCAANLLLSPDLSMALDSIGVLSPDGSSKSFDAAANGYARGDAVEAVYIKRLDDAVRDGNPVRAIIRATAINSDGKTRGLFTPSPDAQSALIRRAYEKAGILRMADTTFVECHGTGTATGDPLELEAIARVFGGGGDNNTYVGSVKPNIGHGEAAAGLSSLIKAVVALEQKTIPPNIKFHTPNPKIPFNEYRLIVPTEPIPWPSDRVQRVSVNSFGMGGANAHVIIDAAPPTAQQNGIYASIPNGIAHLNGSHTNETLTNGTSTNGSYTNGSYKNGSHTNGTQPNGSHKNETLTNGAPAKGKSIGGDQRLLVFSAHSEGSLRKMISNYKDFIEQESFNLPDLAYTLSVRRHHWNVRSFCVTDGKTLQTVPGSKTLKFKGLLFIFTGQGAQWSGMGRELIRDFPTFREDIQKMDMWLAESSHPPSWKIEELLRDSADINSAEFAQPICTALQIALVNLLRQWDVLPAGVVGHSSGEIAAAYAAGALGMKEALLVSYYRGIATRELRRPGAMGALGLGRDDLDGLLVGNAVLACENSRSSVTISGNSEDVEASIEQVSQMRPGVFARKLKVDRAYHSSHMQEVSQLYENLMASIKPEQGKLAVPFFSSVKGCSTRDAASLGPSYWRSNMENPVLFLSAVESALEVKDLFSSALEIGPHSTLSGPFRQICQEMGEKIQYANTLTRGVDCTQSVLTALGHLFCQGLVPRLSVLNPEGVTMSNLPPYPWNHDNSYWHESRISSEFRNREYPEHELLGARVTGGNDLEPSWRKLLDLNQVPWLTDHVISSDIIFPGAGYVAIIVEAIRQLSKSPSYTIRNLSIESAMILRSGQLTEIITRLHPIGTRTKPQQPVSWYDFTVSSFDGEKWYNHCSGKVSVGQDSNQHLFGSDVDIIRQVNRADWYRIGKAAGLEYGATFQGLQNIRCAVGVSEASAEVYDDQLPKGSSYAVHPIAIDQLLQCCIVGSFQGHLRKMKKLVLPIHIGELHVRAQDAYSDLKLRTQTTSHNASSMLANAQIQAVDGSIMLQCENIQFRTLDNNAAEADSNSMHKFHLLEWKPDIDLIDASKLLHRTSDLTSCMKLVEELHILCSIETTRVLENVESSRPHLRRFKQWIVDFITIIQHHGSTIVQETNYMFQITSEERQARIRSLLEEALDTPAKDMALAITNLYDAAEDIFLDKTEALGVLLADDLLTRVYNFQNMVDHEQFLQLLGHSNPDMRILEIGAGTGGFTSTILPALKKPGYGCMFDTYTYTDISAGFFKAAKHRFKDYPNLEFVELDITKDLATQEVQQHSYDLVLASNVLHATPKLHETLSNCRSLLKPGGRLFLLELCADSKFMNYIFGFLPGWWLGESDGRPNEPYVQPAQWDIALRKAGFAGVEASLKDQQSPYHINALLIARATQVESLLDKQLSFLVSNPAAVNEHLQGIQSTFESGGYSTSLCTLQNLPSTPMDIISLLEIDGSGPFFQDISETRFNGLISLIEQCYKRGHKLLWVTRPAQISTEDPYNAMVLGLARTVRLELGSVFATLELDTNEPSPSQCDAIFQVFGKLQPKASLSYGSMDCEFALANGNICISRYIPTNVDNLLRKTTDPAQAIQKLSVENPRLLDSVQWGLQSRAAVLLDEEVEIAVKTASLNAWDYDVARDNTQRDRNPGLECAGLITRVGAKAKLNFQVGDSVLCWSPGSLATHVRIDARYCIKLPDNIPFDQAVTLSIAHATMVRGLVEFCNLANDESILIHPATGADGAAAIQIARMIGAKIFVTAPTEEQKMLLETEFGIPRSHIFSSNDTSFIQGILQSTKARGVDAFVNFLSDDLFSESWKCIAEGGSMLDLSPRDSTSREKLDRSLLGENRSFYSFDMVNLLQQKPLVAQRFLQIVLDLYLHKKGSIQPVSPITKFQPSEIKEAFHHLQAGRRVGPACIEFPEDLTTLHADFFAEESSFRDDRAYLLVGGLGGLGRSAAMWLAERGAGHIIFFSRSASRHADAHSDFLRELSVLGCSYQIVSGSVEDIPTLERVISNSTKPIAGVVHLPLVVWDKPVLGMSHEDWTIATSPKVLGALNLHRAFLKQPLDFFVLLGSANGIRGNHGQANYAAANTFLTTFVRYRQQLNLPASILDMGPVEDVGILSERPQLMDGFRRVGAEMVVENEFLDSFHLAIQSSHLPPADAPTISSGFVNRAQVIIGRIQRPFDARAQGLARIYNGSKIETVVTEQSSGAEKEENAMQKFMENARANPQSWAEDAATSEMFLAKQILEAAKGLLIFDDESDVEDDEDLGLDVSSSLSDLAIDSLLAIELQNWWRQSMGTQISVLELMNGTTVLELGKLARAKILSELNIDTKA